MRLLSEGIVQGHPSPKTIQLQVYGKYLLNGGTPDGFLSLNESDIQIMYTVLESERVRYINDLTKSIARILGAKEV